MIHAVSHSRHVDAGASTLAHGHVNDARVQCADDHNPPPRPDSPRPDKHLQSYFSGFIAALGLTSCERIRAHGTHSPTSPSALLLSTIHEERDDADTMPAVSGSVKAHVLERRRTSKACGSSMSKRRSLHRKVPLRALWEVIINDSNH